MAQRGPPFDFDLNELPPEDDGASDASPVRAPEPMCEPSLRDLLPQETLPSPQHEDSLAPPAPEPSPRDPPVLDLEAPLSSLDDDDDDYDEADLPPPPPLPPFGLPVAAAPALSSSSVDTPRELPFPPSRRGERPSREPFGDAARWLSSPEDPARRGPSRAASGTAPPRRPHSYAPRDDGAISKQRRVDYYDEDAGSSRSGSHRSEPGSPRRYERSELASPPQYGPGGGRRAPAAHGPPGAPPRNRRRRRRRPQHEYQYPGPIQKQQGRGWEQPLGLRGQERPKVHQGHHGPRGPEVPKIGYSSYGPQEPAKIGGYHQHSREAPGLRPSSGVHGGDGSSGGRQSPLRQPVSGGAYLQRKAPRGREHFPDRPYKYNPYARDGGALDRSNGGSEAWREPYERRRDSKQRTSGGGPSRGRPYYGD
ncbi:basic salivary proline-rich protein 2-like [Panicum miliaceum]|uniref:Basic salivary proline-rich protein 2-like n=1 Tax=Panicum miliaceum TaxID=4540 RepID=A0A3L6SSY9_PANMI|nr:basic salivary proline-rich protein 2-like [Panicum miliaceum]